MTLKDIGNIPFKMGVLETVFPDNSAIAAKAKRLEEAGVIMRLKRGMYVVSPQESGKIVNEFLIANHLHGPSYVSMHTALRYYGLIPENVIETISMTVGVAKTYINDVGTFRYIHCSDDYYPIGIRSVVEEEVAFMIATPEKALCDLIAFTSNLNLRYKGEIRRYLEDDLRIDLDEIKDFDIEILQKCAEKGKKKNMLNQIIRLIEHERNF